MSSSIHFPWYSRKLLQSQWATWKIKWYPDSEREPRSKVARVETQRDRKAQPTARDGSSRKYAAGSTGDLILQDGKHPARTVLKDTAKAHLSRPFYWKFCLYKIKVTGENNFQPAYGSFMDFPWSFLYSNSLIWRKELKLYLCPIIIQIEQAFFPLHTITKVVNCPFLSFWKILFLFKPECLLSGSLLYPTY